MYTKYIFLFFLVVGFSLADGSTTKSTAENRNTQGSESKSTISVISVGEDGNSKFTTPLPTTFSTMISTITSSPSSSPTSSPNVTATSSPAPSPAPNTTTTSPSPTPTTTQIPTPSDVWTVTNSTDKITCIIAKMDIVLEVHQQNWTKNFSGNPRTVEAKGECGMDIQTLEIIFPSHKNSSASLIFIFNGTENKYFISSLATTILLNTSAGSKTLNDTQSLNLYETGKNTSYSCPLYVLNFEVNTASVKLSMNDIQIEAFRFTNSTIFSSANYCSSGEVPDIVPLIVGLALAGLVIVVVIGYFIGRRRSQARGYLSM